MPIREIACLHCGFAGMLDIHSQDEVIPKDRLFRRLGHNPYSGALHYQCPACGIVLLVDPMAVLGEKSLKGFPGETAADVGWMLDSAAIRVESEFGRGSAFAFTVPVRRPEEKEPGEAAIESFEFLMKSAKSPSRRKPESSLFRIFWIPDQARNDDGACLSKVP